jgi:hypothetical protein
LREDLPPSDLEFESSAQSSMSYVLVQRNLSWLKYSVLIVVTALLVSCEQAHKTEEVVSPQQMQATLEKAVPKGMALEDAKGFMESEGFVCEEVKGGTWKGKKGLTFLHCKREDGQMIKRRWEVALMHDGKTVSALEMRTALVYP